MSKNVVVIGGGVAGITTAYALLQRGHKVTLLERNERPADECSYANGGQLSVSNSEVWNTWANVQRGLKWMLSSDAPLAIRPTHWSIPKVKWIAGFIGATINNKYDQNTRATIEMAIESGEILREITKTEKLKYDQRFDGIVHLYRTPESFQKAKDVCRQFVGTGWGRYPISKDKVAELAGPIVTTDIIGGTYTPNDFTGDVHMFCYHLLKVCMNRGMVYGIEDISPEKLCQLYSKYDEVVVCAGAYTSKLVPSLNIYPVKGYSVTFDVPEKVLPKVSLLDEQAKIVTSSYKGRFRVAGTAELGGWNHDIRQDRIRPLVRWTYNNTHIANEPSQEWACLRPMTPDMMPVVGRRDGVIVNSGAGHLGWTMCMALANRTAELV